MLDAKDAELAKVWAELEAERRARTNAEKLRGQLTKAQTDVKSFKKRLGMAKADAEEARKRGTENFRCFSDSLGGVEKEKRGVEVDPNSTYGGCRKYGRGKWPVATGSRTFDRGSYEAS
jgi:hypothetical protein